MTKLTKPVRRETNDFVRESGKMREVVVIMRPPNVLGFKAKGCRREYQLTTEACYTAAVQAEINAARTEKRKSQKTRTVNRGMCKR